MTDTQQTGTVEEALDYFKERPADGMKSWLTGNLDLEEGSINVP